MTVHLDAAAVSLGNYACCSGLVSEQCELPKVVASLILFDFLGGLARVEYLGSVSLSRDEEVQLPALITLGDNGFALLVLGILKRLRDLRSLVVVHSLEQRYLLQESLILLPLANGSVLYDMIECLPVKGVQNALFVGRDAGRSRCVIKERELSESLSGLVLLQQSRLSVALENLRARESAARHNVQAFALIALFDDSLVCFGPFFLHGIYDYFLLSVVQSREHEGFPNLVHDGRLCRLTFLNDFSLESFFLVEGSKGLRRHRATRALGGLLYEILGQDIYVVIVVLNIRELDIMFQCVKNK